MNPRAETMAGPGSDILNSLASGVLAVDQNRRILFVSRALWRRLGIEAEAWVGRPVSELASLLASRFGTKEAIPSRLDWDPADHHTYSKELELHDGNEVLHLREDSRPLRDGAGRVVGQLFAYHDISREKAIDRMKSEFIAVASHELRTPMTSIKGSVDLILSGYAGDISGDTQELLEIAQKNCDRLIRLINDILDLAKIEAGQIKLKLQPMDLTDAVERSMRGVKAIADQTDVTLTLAKPERLPPVEVDKDRIEQVVTNLLSNAIKFSPPKGEVRIELTAEDAWVQCSVVDEGCGIADDQLKNVFGKFQQFGESPRKGGTGLGLAISQALVHEHRGRIWVESRVNEGSRFIFRLPALSGLSSG